MIQEEGAYQVPFLKNQPVIPYVPEIVIARKEGGGMGSGGRERRGRRKEGKKSSPYHQPLWLKQWNRSSGL